MILIITSTDQVKFPTSRLMEITHHGGGVHKRACISFNDVTHLTYEGTDDNWSFICIHILTADSIVLKWKQTGLGIVLYDNIQQQWIAYMKMKYERI